MSMMRTPIPFCSTREKSFGKREKLLAILYDKKRSSYIIAICINVLVTVSALQRSIVYAQSPWLREYIELNTNFRTLAKNEFEKNLFKLMNNAVFSKTMENMRNHVNVQLVMGDT